MKFTFGKYKGIELNEVPISYLEWALENAYESLSPFLIEDIKAILARQGGGDFRREKAENINNFRNKRDGYYQDNSHRWGEGRGYGGRKKSFMDSFDEASVPERDLVKRWYREMARKYHPDKDLGSDESMKIVNDCYERLLEMMEQN